MLPPLHDAWPGFNALPRAPLTQLPTPIHRYPQFAQQHKIHTFSVKHDNLTSCFYGGNKVRKLEYLLGHAVATQRTSIMTFGYAGSNFCLASSLYARQLGLQNHVFLLPQVNSQTVRHNLLLNQAAGAHLHHYANKNQLIAGVIAHTIKHVLKPSMRINAGGSDPLGILGFVNAAYEYPEQLQQQQANPVDRLYIAFGSMGSVAGLALGLAAQGLLGQPTKIITSRVVPEPFASLKALRRMLQQTLRFIRRYAPTFAQDYTVEEILAHIQIRDEFFGREYGDRSPAALAAIEDAQTIDMPLDATYSAKAFATLLADAQAGLLTNQHVLFWNTYNSASLDDLAMQLNCDNPSLDRDIGVTDLDYRTLPKAFWPYFDTASHEYP